MSQSIITIEGTKYINMDRVFFNMKTLIKALREAQPSLKHIEKCVATFEEYANEVREEEKRRAEIESKKKEAEKEVLENAAQIASQMGLTTEEFIEVLAKTAGKRFMEDSEPSSSSTVTKKAGKKVKSKRPPRYKYTDKNGEVKYYSGVGARPAAILKFLEENPDKTIEHFAMSDEEIRELMGSDYIHNGIVASQSDNPTLRKNVTRMRRMSKSGSRNLNPNNLQVQALLSLPRFKDYVYDMNPILSKVAPKYKYVDSNGVTHWSTGRGRAHPVAIQSFLDNGGTLDEILIPERERKVELVEKLRSEGDNVAANNIIAVEAKLLKLCGTEDDMKEYEELKSRFDSSIALHPLVKSVINGEEDAIYKVLGMETPTQKVVQESLNNVNDLEGVSPEDEPEQADASNEAEASSESETEDYKIEHEEVAQSQEPEDYSQDAEYTTEEAASESKEDEDEDEYSPDVAKNFTELDF
jgi:DNA-binding protein H-NS